MDSEMADDKTRELKAVAKAESDPDTAMGEGKKVPTDASEPTQPLDPKTHDTGQNYLGKETIFTREAELQKP